MCLSPLQSDCGQVEDGGCGGQHAANKGQYYCKDIVEVFTENILISCRILLSHQPEAKE